MSKSHLMVVDVLDDLCRQFGVWPVVRGLFRTVLKRRQQRNDVSGLSDRMLRDIGLPVEEFDRHRPMVDLLRVRR